MSFVNRWVWQIIFLLLAISFILLIASPSLRDRILTVVKRWIWLVIFLLLAIGLPLFAASLSAQENMDQSRFAKYTSVAINDRLNLNIMYPERLRRDPLEKRGLPLMVWMTDTQQLLTTDSYTVTFDDEAHLLWSNDEEQFILPQIVLTTSVTTTTMSTFYLRPAPLTTSLNEKIDVGIAIQTPNNSPTNPIDPLTILVESASTSRDRFFWNFLSGDLSAAISVALALAGAVTTYLLQQTSEAQEQRKQAQEQQASERRERIQSIRDRLVSEPLNAMVRWVGIAQQARDEHWERSLLAQLRDLESQLKPLDPEPLLQHINDLLKQRQVAEAQTRLEALEHFVEDTVAQQLAKVHSTFSTRPLSPAPTPSDVLGAALALWEQFNEHVRDIVVLTILAIKPHFTTDQLRSAFRDPAGKLDESRRRLLRDPRLRHIDPSNTALAYDWPSVWQQDARPEDPALLAWLDSRSLKFNPFRLGTSKLPWPLDGTLLEKSWEAPHDWNQMRAPLPMIIINKDQQERRGVADILHSQLQPNLLIAPMSSVPIAFVVRLALPLAEADSSAAVQEYFYLIARAFGETWIALLALNPDALLDLPLDEQVALAELLLWVAGSLSSLLLRLRQASLREDTEAVRLLKVLSEYGRRLTPSVAPPTGVVLSWLGLRPSNLTYTYLIAEYAADDSGEVYQDQICTLANLSSVLARVSVILKLFVPTTALVGRPAVHQIRLEWDARQLTKMLSDRISLASDGYYPSLINLLFLHPTPDARIDEQIVQRARGSLGTLLKLCSIILEKQSKRSTP